MQHETEKEPVIPNIDSTRVASAYPPMQAGRQTGQPGGGLGVAFAPPRTASKVRVTWAKLKRRVGNGSAPDDSLGDLTTATDGTSDGGSSFGRGRRGGGSQAGREDKLDEKEETDHVDEVVVEATGSPEFWKTAALPSQNGSNKDGGTGTGTNGLPPGLQSEGSSLRHTAYEASGVVGTVGNWFRWRCWPRILNFFSPHYHDKNTEDLYQKEVWYTSKSTAIFGACFLVLQWVLLVSLLVRPWSRFNEFNNYLVGPLLNVPLVVLAAFDVPRRRPLIWQAWLFLAITMSSIANLIDMHLCGFYTATPSCGRKDFQATLFWIVSGPTVGLFALGLKRIIMVVISVIWFVLAGALLLPVRASFIRNMINVAIFHGFIIFTHYMREMSDRRMYTMRAELKTQFKAKQRAQISERKTLDAKRRFSSYIFHEVRVPLNTALLAVQNLTHTQGYNNGSEAAEEFAALEGSLQMMSQVLNDVLDYTRMERGGFSSVSRPFSLHNTMRSIFAPLRIDTNARGLALEVSLDPRIDFVAHRAAYFEEYVDEDGNPKQDPPLLQEGEGYMCGDEVRLRQVINNLASNAAKFTPAGGKITIRTSLVYPIDGYPRYNTTAQELSEVGNLGGADSERTVGDHGITAATDPTGLSEGRLLQHDGKTNGRVRDNVLVARIEVEDTGVGIRARDMAEARLFSAYVQTEIGKKQGGKGTGLGLSLVRQIVMLSGGRLGVKSKVGEGSTFWVELPFAIGPETRQADQYTPNRHMTAGLDKDLTPSSGATGSDASEYRFVPVLTNEGRKSDTGLQSINESDKSSFLSMPHRMSSASSGPSIGASSPLISPPLVFPPPAFLALDAPPPVFPLVGQGSVVTSSPIARPGDRPDTARPAPPEELMRPPNPATLSSSSAPPAPQSAPASSSPSTTLSRSSALEFADGPLKVLVVDDDALTRKLMARLLTRLGCVISTAENGAIALEMILDQSSRKNDSGGSLSDPSQADQPIAVENVGIGVDPRHVSDRNYDVVFLDNQMPICSGLQVVSRMRSLGRDDLIVGITANALIADQEEYIERGASAVLTKPVLEVDLRKYLIKADRMRAERKANPAGTQGTHTTNSSAASTPRTSFAVPRRR